MAATPDEKLTLRRVGGMTMTELVRVAQVNLGPGFAERVKEVLGDDERRPRRDGNGKRSVILVADGDPDIAALLKLVIEDGGFEVIRADDGEEAMMLALEHRPDMCVLDTDLPHFDGPRATRLLRAADQTRTMPVLLLTTGVRPDTIDAGQAAGADAHLIKPFTPDELIGSVRTTLKASARA